MYAYVVRIHDNTVVYLSNIVSTTGLVQSTDKLVWTQLQHNALVFDATQTEEFKSIFYGRRKDIIVVPVQIIST